MIAAVFAAAAVPSLISTCSGRKMPDDFHVVYSGARAMLDRAEIYSATKRMFIYSPFVAFVFQPLALFPEQLAATIWFLLIAVIIVGAAIIVAFEVAEIWQLSRFNDDCSIPWVSAAGALLLSFEKIRSEFVLGQIDCLILLGLAVILVGAHRRPQLVPLLVGVAANFKYLALIFVGYFIIKRCYRAAIGSVLWFAFFFALPCGEIGGRLTLDYALNALAVLGKVFAGRSFVEMELGNAPPVVNSVTWDNSISLTSWIFRASQWLRIPDSLAGLISAILVSIVVAALVWIGRRRDLPLLRFAPSAKTNATSQLLSLEWAALIVFALSFGPQTTPRHMIMLIPVYVVGIALFFVDFRRGRELLLLGATITTALLLSLPFRQTGVHPLLIILKSGSVASWFAILLMFSIAAIGCDTIARRRRALAESLSTISYQPSTSVSQ